MQSDKSQTNTSFSKNINYNFEDKKVLVTGGAQGIGFEITSIDQISQRSGIQIDEVACGLAELELQGIVKAVPGGYMRCY